MSPFFGIDYHPVKKKHGTAKMMFNLFAILFIKHTHLKNRAWRYLSLTIFQLSVPVFNP